MTMIIETCPKCGHDLLNEVICTNPPIPKKCCPSCGWSWEGEPEQIMRVPFGDNSLNCDKTCLHGDVDYGVIDSSSCMANNIDGHVYFVTNVDDITRNRAERDRIAEAIENIFKYIKEK